MLPVYNWQDPSLSPYTPPAPAKANTRSPNMLAILRHLLDNFGGNNLGILNVRPQTAGTRWSSHAFGAALDWGFIDYTTGKPNQVMRLAVIDFLIAHHEALGVQMIIDEGFNRTWKSYRADQNGPGWKVGTGVWGSWLHIETTLTMWANSTPVADRLTPPPPITPPPPMEDDDMSTARLWQHPKYANVWLVGPSTLHLSGKLAASYVAAGIPLIVEDHDQTLKSVLFQCGLTTADLVPD